jgi:hypothetical protein
VKLVWHFGSSYVVTNGVLYPLIGVSFLGWLAVLAFLVCPVLYRLHLIDFGVVSWFLMCYLMLSTTLVLMLHCLAINHATWSFLLICWSFDVLITFSTTWVLLLHFVAIKPSDILCYASVLSDWVLLMVKLCALIGFVDLLLPMVVKRWFVASSE